MANRQRGEVALEIEGQTYTLALNTNAMVVLEESFEESEYALVLAQRDQLRDALGEIALAKDLKQASALAKRALLNPATSITFQRVLEKVNDGAVKYIRAVVWAALQEHHPEITLTRAGQLIQEAGGVVGFTAQLQALAAATAPDGKDLDALQIPSDGNPPKAQVGKRAGTGGRSTSRPVASA